MIDNVKKKNLIIIHKDEKMPWSVHGEVCGSDPSSNWESMTGEGTCTIYPVGYAENPDRDKLYKCCG